ncbi:unnamed protein product [Fraxinus pennsylvanica]|uniref:Uncharacterized protein n=1 Tax=Fraxinus pennsylvanica TaxID=56036 RepID=A0AAD1ZI57_9LAMI|nr:unnamed protein product [Fraxinus pennsylvanica]
MPSKPNTDPPFVKRTRKENADEQLCGKREKFGFAWISLFVIMQMEEACKGRLMDAEVLVNEANVSKTEILKKVEEATEEVKITKKVLEESLNRVEAANKAKLTVEEALRKWRSERDSSLLYVSDLDLVGNKSKPVLKPSLSIRQILSQKLLLKEVYENGMQAE